MLGNAPPVALSRRVGIRQRAILAWISVSLTIITGFQASAGAVAGETTTSTVVEEKTPVVVDLVSLLNMLPPVLTETLGSNGSVAKQVVASSYVTA